MKYNNSIQLPDLSLLSISSTLLLKIHY